MRKDYKVGDRINNLEIIEKLGMVRSADKKRKTLVPLWLCKCLAGGIECRKQVEARHDQLKREDFTNCGSATCKPRFKDLTGKVFGRLTVINYGGIQINNSNDTRSIWNCECSCGNKTVVPGHYLTKGSVSSCGCLGKESRSKNGKSHFRGYEDITGAWFGRLRNGARVRNIDFTITMKDIWDIFIKQNKKCMLSGIELSFVGLSASVDRIDSNKGYTINNIQIVHKVINLMKGILSNNLFVSLCKIIGNNGSNNEIIIDEMSLSLKDISLMKSYKSRNVSITDKNE